MHHYYSLTERGDSDSDAELWKSEEFAGLDHKMSWFKGKNWAKKRPVFVLFLCPFLKMHKGKNKFSERVGTKIREEVVKEQLVIVK